MRDFTWNYFSLTGDVNAYLLYKEVNAPAELEEPVEALLAQEETEIVV